MAQEIADRYNPSRQMKVNEDGSINTNTLNSFITEPFDFIGLTYVLAGNGIGKIETATYKSGGAGGTTVGILTLAYNADNKISSVTKT